MCAIFALGPASAFEGLAGAAASWPAIAHVSSGYESNLLAELSHFGRSLLPRVSWILHLQITSSVHGKLISGAFGRHCEYQSLSFTHSLP